MSSVLKWVQGSFFWVFFLVTACSDNGASTASQKVPLPGMSTLPQILIFRDATRGLSDTWAEPDAASFAPEFPAHVIVERLASEEDAVEKFNIYNGRPVDFLFLGQGLPQRIFGRLKLPRNPKRVVFSLNPVKSIEATPLKLSMVSVKTWVEDFCAQKFLQRSCELEPQGVFATLKSRGKPGFLLGLGARKLDVSSKGRPVMMSIFVDWDAFFRKQLLDFRAGKGGVQKVRSDAFDLNSTFLKIENGDALKASDPKFVEQIERFKRDSILKFLGMSSVEHSSPVPLDLIRGVTPQKPGGLHK